MDRRNSVDAWVSTAGRIVGLLFLVAFGVLWIITDRFNPFLASAAGLLYGLAKIGQARAMLLEQLGAPPPVPDTTTRTPEDGHE